MAGADYPAPATPRRGLRDAHTCGYDIVDIGKHYDICACADTLSEELTNATLDVGNDFLAFTSAEDSSQLVEIVAQKLECVFVDIENLAVDVGRKRSFHCRLISGGVTGVGKDCR